MSTTNGTPPPPRMALSPRDLPRHLVEREQEVAALRDLLLDPERRHAVVIYGMGGVGKTTLARAIWKDPQVRETFRDGLLWATLGVAPHLGDAQIAWAAMVCDTPLTQAVIAPTTSATTRASLLRAILYNRQYLVVIDDAWDSTDVAGLLLGGPNCAAVITTRIRTVAEDFAPSYMYLDGITSDQALNLLARRLGEPIDDSARADAERLAARLGYMPLALELAAAQVSGRGTSWAELIEMLDADPSGIRLLHQGEPWLHTATIPACFDDSVRILSPDLAQRLFLLGVFAAGRVAIFDATAAAAVWELPVSQARRDLGMLLDLGLLSRDERGYWLHPLLHDYAAGQLQPIQRREAQVRHADYYYQSFARESEERWQATETALPQLRAAWRTTLSDPERAFTWASALTAFLGRRGLWDDYHELVNAADAAVKKMRWRGYEGRCANWLGLAHRAASQEDSLQRAREEFQRSLDLMREVGDNYGQATALTNLGNLAYQQGDYDLALTYYERSQGRWPKSERAKQVDTLVNRASIARIRGQHAIGLDLCQQALKIAQNEQNGNREQAATVLAEMGLLYGEQGNAAQAQAVLDQSRTMMDQLGNKAGVAVALLNLGLVCFAAKDLPKAEQYFVEVLAANERTTMATALCNLGLTLAQDEAKFHKALSALNDGLMLAQESGDQRLQALALRNIADIRRRQNRGEEVLALLKLAGELYGGIGLSVESDIVQQELHAIAQRVAASPLARGFEAIYRQVWSDTLRTKSRVIVADTINSIQQEAAGSDDIDVEWVKGLFSSLERLAPSVRASVGQMLSDPDIRIDPRLHAALDISTDPPALAPST